MFRGREQAGIAYGKRKERFTCNSQLLLVGDGENGSQPVGDLSLRLPCGPVLRDQHLQQPYSEGLLWARGSRLRKSLG